MQIEPMKEKFEQNLEKCEIWKTGYVYTISAFQDREWFSNILF